VTAGCSSGGRAIFEADSAPLPAEPRLSQGDDCFALATRARAPAIEAVASRIDTMMAPLVETRAAPGGFDPLYWRSVAFRASRHGSRTATSSQVEAGADAGHRGPLLL